MGKFPSHLFWVGEQSDHPLVKNRKKDYVMDSVIHHYQTRQIKLKYTPGRLFLDSGAFTAAMQNITLDRERVLSIQEKLAPDLAIPLDYPLRPDMSIPLMRKAWLKTKENMLYWQECSTLSGRIVPTLHSWDRQSMANNIRWISKKIDCDYIAIGVVVNPDFSGYRGFFKDRQPRRDLIRMIHEALMYISHTTDLRVHVMGMGSSPLMLHLAYYLGIVSTDSTGYRRKAAFGKIILPGTSERYVGSTIGNFGRKKITKSEMGLLQQCTCPTCSKDPSKLWTSWTARAIHNEFVMKKEAEKARQLISQGDDIYERYLDGLFINSKYGLQYLWKYTKMLKKYRKLSDIEYRL